MTQKLQGRIQRLSKLIQKRTEHLENARNLRLIIGLSIFGLIVLSGALPKYKILSLSVPIAAIPFVYFFLKSKNLSNHINSLNLWKSFLLRQHQRILGEYQQTFSDDLKSYSENVVTRGSDLHLFGNKSLFTLMDETITDGGHKTLLNWALDPTVDGEQILLKQGLIKKLAQKNWLLLKLKIQSDSQEPKIEITHLTHQLENTLVGPQFGLYWLGHLILCPLAWSLTIASITGAISLNLALPVTIYFLYFIASKGQILESFQKAENLSVQLEKLKSIFSFIETHLADSEISTSLKHTLNCQPSRDLRSLNRYAAGLSVQGHPLAYLFVNAIFPWDYLFSKLVETWRIKWKKVFPEVMEELYALEAHMSAAFFLTYQTQNFPTFSDSYTKLSFTHLRHPLIPRSDVVSNSWSLPPGKSLTLITGSNMSGKSTFLRTLGINHQLALMGCPVFAENMTTTLSPIFTCLQVADNLEAGYSTFYYEVRQISKMIQKAKGGDQFIFLIDEIFRGTNNRERLIGSKTVIEELASSPKCLGVITTHDLELTQLSEQFKSLTNWHFKDDVEANQLTFSYKIQQGPCPTTNALKIMANEGLPVKV